MHSIQNRVIALTLIVAAASFAMAADWPQWGGTDCRNLVSPEKNLPASFDPDKGRKGSGGNVKWVRKTGNATYGNPTVSDGRVYVGTDDASLSDDPRLKRTRGGMVHCFDEATGKPIWKLVIPKRMGLPKEMHYGHQHLGTCSSPTVQGDSVYVVTGAAEVLCLDVQGQANGNDGPYQDEAQYIAGSGRKPIKLAPSDGDIKWRFDTIDQAGSRPHDVASCSVVLHGDYLYTSTSNGVDGPHTKVVAPEAPAMIVLDKRTGRYVARETEGISSRLWHAQWCSPSVGQVNGKALVVLGGGDGILYAFEALTGKPATSGAPASLKTAWRYDCNPRDYRYRADGTKILYQRIHGTARNTTRGEGPCEIIATPVLYKQRIYVAIGQDPRHGTGKGCLSCVDAASGKKIWESRLVERSLSTCSIYEGLLYIADYTGNLHCFNPDTGKRLWVHHTDSEYGKWVFKTNSPLWSSTFAADGKVYLGTEKKDLWVFRAGRKKKVLNRIRLLEKMSNTPIAANGILYIATGRRLYAVAGKK